MNLRSGASGKTEDSDNLMMGGGELVSPPCLTDTSRLPFAFNNLKTVEIEGPCLGRGN